MGRRATTTYTFTDDLSGEELEESEVERFIFQFQGVDRELYLSADNARDFKAFIQASSRIEKAAPKAKSAGNRGAEVRAWWKDNKVGDLEFNPRGKIAQAVYDAYDAAH